MRVVLAACGIVSPLGIGLGRFSQRMLAGESGLSDIHGTVVSPTFPVHVAGLVPTEQLSSPTALLNLAGDSVPKSWLYAAVATEEAVTELGGVLPVDAIVYATSDGTNFDLIKQTLRDRQHVQQLRVSSESSAHVIARVLEAHGWQLRPTCELVVMNNGCVSGNQAIGMAAQRIESGEWNRVVVGGVESRCIDYNLMDFHLLGALTTSRTPDASRPFSADRSGFVRGEGAATLILESERAARECSHIPMSYVTGYASTGDAYRLTDGHPRCLGATRAMENCLRSASMPKKDVTAISAHGTSTLMNDRLETLAIKEVFGELARSLPVTSLKSQIGHATVAAGALEAIACTVMLQQQMLAPTINYSLFDPECDLDYVPNVSRPTRLQNILSNNFGFGGQNACLLLEKAD